MTDFIGNKIDLNGIRVETVSQHFQGKCTKLHGNYFLISLKSKSVISNFRMKKAW